MSTQLGILLGDDIGPEVVPEAIAVASAALDGAGAAVQWIDIPIGRAAFDATGTTMPADTLDRLAALDGWVLGPIGHQAYRDLGEGAFNPHPIIRKHFDLYANIRPALSFANIPSLHDRVDVLIVRENNEGFQPDRNMVAGVGEFMPSDDMALSVRVITRQASARLARIACEYAMARGRHVTAVHKDTVFRLGCGLFAEECRKVAGEFPDITFDEVMVDTFALKLVMDPKQFDVVVITNLFGDIMSDLAAGLVGGLGLAPALQMGPKYAMAQAAHGSAPDIAGKGVANPYALIMSVAMLVDWLGRGRGDGALIKAAAAMDGAIKDIISDAKTLTPDLGGTASTGEMGRAVAERAASLAAA